MAAEEPTNPNLELDYLSQCAIELAASRHDPSVSGKEYAERIITLMELARGEAFKAGRAIGIIVGRNEVVGTPRAADKSERKKKKSLNLVEIKQMREEYTRERQAHGGIVPTHLVKQLSEKYGVSRTTVYRFCTSPSE